jgi:CubicO group peptidase (beta-lactamase class C family)
LNSLTSAVEDQEARFSLAFAILRQAVADRAFPCASTAITQQGKLLGLQSFGRFTFELDAPPALPGTIFDLASVSKGIATTTMAMILYQRGMLDLDMLASVVVPEFAHESQCHDSQKYDPRRETITIRMLLAHASGLPAHVTFYKQARTREELVQLACTTPLSAEPGARVEYSDVGFLVLGEALIRLADENLDSFCQREIFGPYGMTHTGYCPPPELRPLIPPTVNATDFRHRIIQGEVNDENAGVMGGIAAHAGIFACAEDVALFAHRLLTDSAPVLRPETIALFTRCETSPAGTSRALGWDTPSAPSQAGRYFSPTSFGHLGYTGTSLWLDPERQVSITLLTNRTWPDCKNKAIQQVRPCFYDAVMDVLTKA